MTNMATKDETADIAVLATKVEALSDGMKSLSTRFDVFQTNFIRNDVYNIKHEELTIRMASLERELGARIAANAAEIKILKNLRWVLVIGATALGSLLTFLIIYALTHKAPI